jgi:hypothetical protein
MAPRIRAHRPPASRLIAARADALFDSQTPFWARVTPGGGVQSLAQARDSNHIFTGAGSVPVNTWLKVEVQRNDQPSTTYFDDVRVATLRADNDAVPTAPTGVSGTARDSRALYERRPLMAGSGHKLELAGKVAW